MVAPLRPIATVPFFVAVALGCCCDYTDGHGILAKPKSKSSGTLLVSSEESLTTYFALASFGIVDKAFFDGDHGITPWTRPGEFTYRHALDLLPGHPQTLHPCGCNAGGVAQCIGVGAANGFGETTLGAAQGTPQPVVPPEWPLGSRQETGWNAYANHAGGYIYTLCKKTTFDACRETHMPNGALAADQAQRDAYLGCVWDCFESGTLEWVPGSQKIQYEDDACAYATTNEMEKVGKEGRIWRFMPIPDTTQVSGGGEGLCTWDAVTGFSTPDVEAKFTQSFGTSDVCDTGPDAHGPKKWHIMDEVQVPTDIPEGEYLLGWRWDAYMADQLWTGCADVKIVSSYSSSDAAASEPDCPPAAPVSSPPVAAPVPSPVVAPVESPTEPVDAPTDSPVAGNRTTTNAPVPAPPPPPTGAPATNPSPTAGNDGLCTDLPLPGNWGANGEHDCGTYYDHGGVAYCAHAEIAANCCFCPGGGYPGTMSPTGSPTASPGGCEDRPLPGNWGANGIYDCDYYERHGGTAYCGHADIENNCCFCGGG